MEYGRKGTTYHNFDHVLLFIYHPAVIMISGNRIQSKTNKLCSVAISFFV